MVKVEDEINMDSVEEIGTHGSYVYHESQSNNPDIKLEEIDAEVTMNDTEDYFEQIDNKHYENDTNDEIIDSPISKNKRTKVVPINVTRPQENSIDGKNKNAKHPDKYMRQLLAEVGANTDAYRNEYNTFIMELSTVILHPFDVIDTPECRILSSFALNNYSYEKSGDCHLCPLCKAEFNRRFLVRKHLFSHGSEKFFRCILCSKRFPTHKNLQDHMRCAHANSRTFPCTICHKEFTLKATLKVHIRRFHDKTTERVRLHQEKSTQLHQYQEQKETVYITLYECYVCKKDFRMRQTLRIHFKLHMRHKARVLCTICGRQFTKAALIHHMEIHTNGKSKPHKCTTCDKSFRVRRSLLHHNRTVHQLYADKGQPLCKVCGKLFDNKLLLYNHMKIHPAEKDDHKFICTICDYSTKTSTHLRNHMQKHGERKHECNICHKKTTAITLQQHLRRHTKPRNYKCTICDKAFFAPSASNSHMKTHSHEKHFKCDICKNRFSTAANLRRHELMHCNP